MSTGIVPGSRNMGASRRPPVVINIPSQNPPGFWGWVLTALTTLGSLLWRIRWTVGLIALAVLAFYVIRFAWNIFLSVMSGIRDEVSGVGESYGFDVTNGLMWVIAIFTLIVAIGFFRRSYQTARQGGQVIIWPLSENGNWLLFGWLGVLIIPLLFDDYRDWWWNLVTAWKGLVIIALFTLYGYMMKSDPNKYFRWKLADYTTWILVLVAVLYVFGPQLRAFYETEVKSGALFSSFSWSSDEFVMAPAAGWSEKIEITPGTILEPERPVFFMDAYGVKHEDNAGDVEPTIVSPYVRAQSRDGLPVKVTVLR